MSKVSKKLSRDGFSLVEILVAMIVFVLGSLSVWALFIAAIDTYNHTVDETAIGLLAETIVAEIKDVEMQKWKPLKAIRRGTNEHFPDFSYDVSYRPLDGDAVFVTIVIYGNRRGKEFQKTFHTVLNRVFPEQSK